MEVVPINNGVRTVYEVRFNGSAITSCFHDTDCPGAAMICAMNETWTAHPVMCTCDGTMGFVGLG